jgi:hypothetical protein
MIVWVDEKTDEEAKMYARKIYPDVSDAELASFRYYTVYAIIEEVSA